MIYQLLPHMKAAQPEDVLLKYASRRKLAPAQLERLGHVFNTATTLTTLEKDRDAAPYLIDVPKMTRGYIDTEGRSKKASWLDESSSQEPSGQTKAASEIPAVWAETPGEIEIRTLDTTDLTGVRRQTFYKAASLAEQACEEEVEAVCNFDSVISKIASVMRRDADPKLAYATLLADARALGADDATELAASKLAAAFAEYGIDVNSGDSKPPEFVLARDRTGHYNNLCEAADYLKTAVDRHATVEQAMEYAIAAGRTLASDPAIPTAAQKCAHNIGRYLDAGGLFKASRAEAAQKKTMPDDLGVSPYIDQIEQISAKAQRGEEGGEFSRLLAPTLGIAVQGSRGVVRGMGDVAGKAPGFVREFTPDGTFGTMFADTAARNQRQVEGHKLDRDRIAEDTRSLGILKALLIRDEVLSTKDPERVLEAFHTIRSASPEVASDPSMLRLLLRQAMETQGVDIDTATAARKFEHGSYRKETASTPPQPARA